MKHRNKKNQKKIEHQGGVGNFQGISYKCNLSLWRRGARNGTEKRYLKKQWPHNVANLMKIIKPPSPGSSVKLDNEEHEEKYPKRHTMIKW